MTIFLRLLKASFIFLLLIITYVSMGVNTPIVRTPADNSVNQRTSLLSLWLDYDSRKYKQIVELSTDSTFTADIDTFVFNYGVYYSTINNLTLDTRYFWRARSIDTANSDTSSYSSTFRFNTQSDFKLYSPFGAVYNSNLYLSVAKCQFEFYHFQFDTSRSFNSSLFQSKTIHDSIQNLSTGFENGTLTTEYSKAPYSADTVFFKVRGIRGTDTSDWSNISHSLITGDNSITYKWPTRYVSQLVQSTLHKGCIRTVVEFDTSLLFNSPKKRILNFDSLDPTSDTHDTLAELIHLDYNTTYYCRSKNYRATDTSDWFVYSDNIKTMSGYFSADIKESWPIGNWLYYSADTMSDGVQIQLDTSVDFNSLALEDTSILLNYVQNSRDYFYDIWDLPILFYNKKYYVRRRLFHSRDTSDWHYTDTKSTYGYYNIHPQGPFPYAKGFAFSLSTDTAKRATYHRIQIDLDSTFSSSELIDTAITGYYSEPFFYADLKFNTKYYYRTQLGHAQDTAKWSNEIGYLQSFTTANSPALKYPQNNFGAKLPVKQKIEWYSQKNVTYQIQLDTSESFASPVLMDSLLLSTNTANNSPTESLLIPNLYFDKEYKWRVRVVSDTRHSEWSPVWRFTTTDTVYQRKPNDTKLNADISAFTWGSIEGTTGYIINIDPTEELSGGYKDTVMENDPFFHHVLTHDISLIPGTTYYWSLTLFNLNDTLRLDTLSFITRDPVPVTQVTPARDGKLGHWEVEFTWLPYTDASQYLLDIADNPTMDNKVSHLTGATSHNLVLDSAKTYYWQVRALATQNRLLSDQITPWKVTTGSTYLKPNLKLPANESINVSVNPNLEWLSQSLVDSYDIEIAQNSELNNNKAYTTTGTNYQLPKLQLNTKYYWRTRATKDTKKGPWSDIWHFTTTSTNGITNAEELGVRVYPNPTDRILSLDLNHLDLLPTYVADSRGKVMLDLSSISDQSKIDVSSLPAGIYILTLKNNSEFVHLKFTKQ